MNWPANEDEPITFKLNLGVPNTPEASEAVNRIFIKEMIRRGIENYSDFPPLQAWKLSGKYRDLLGD